MLIYHASKEIVEVPEIRKTRFTKDFSWGFYCTNNFAQAVRWALGGIQASDPSDQLPYRGGFAMLKICQVRGRS